MMYGNSAFFEFSELMLRRVAIRVGNTTPVDLRPARDWDHSGKRFGSTDKSRRELGFEAKVSVREGLEKTVAWTRANRATIERCMAQHAYNMAHV